MARDAQPLIALEEGGQASVLNYNVPEPTSYGGTNFIDLVIDASDFTAKAFEIPETETETDDGDTSDGGPTGTLNTGVLENLGWQIDQQVDPGPDPMLPDKDDIPDLDPGIGDEIGPGPDNGGGIGRRTRRSLPTATQEVAGAVAGYTMSASVGRISIQWIPNGSDGYDIHSNRRLSESALSVTPETVLERAARGEKPVLQKNLYGTLDIRFIPIPLPSDVKPQILLLEKYRLSSFLGAYGAGRTIKTFSLLPDEKTVMSIRTFRKTEEDYHEASSILDSFTEESQQEFVTTLENEQTSSEGAKKSSEYYADAEASASWGWGSAEVSGGMSSASSSSREEFAKNVSSSVEKSAMTASAKRDLQIETSLEVKQVEEEEVEITREIKNINVSRTLNFVFRQMNQEFVTLLHLVDVRVAFFNGFNETKMEVTLPELDKLLAEYVKADKQAEVRERIIAELSNIFDWRGEHHSFVEERELRSPDGAMVARYLRANTGTISRYENPSTGTAFVVPGVIISENTNVLRTEGVIVDAILGQGEALDDYSASLQEDKIRNLAAGTAAAEIENQKQRMAMGIVRRKDNESAELYLKLFGESAEEEEG